MYILPLVFITCLLVRSLLGQDIVQFRVTRNFIYFFLSKEAKRDNIWICFTQLHKLWRRKTEEHYDKAAAQMTSVPFPCFTFFTTFFAIKIRYARSDFFGYLNTLPSKRRVNEFRCVIPRSLCPARDFRKTVVCTESHIMAVKILV